MILQKQKQEKKMHQNQKHNPVMLNEVLHNLNPKTGDRYLDLTAGYGGHANPILEITGNYKGSYLVDRDPSAYEFLNNKFKDSGVNIINKDFYSASEDLLKSGQKFDIILADLGVSSPHLNEPNRGFSIDKDGPLDMRMDQSQKLDAYEIVNNYSEKQLAKIIKEYGEDPKFLKIANLIVHNRPIKNTTDLAKIVSKAWPGHSKTHPATRTFQAVRIAVNDELSLIKKSLPIWIEILNPGGRIAIISFQSLEDRIVKQFLADRSGNKLDSILSLVSKKPIIATKDELVFNPRSRSAKLRVAVKINNKKKGE